MSAFEIPVSFLASVQSWLLGFRLGLETSWTTFGNHLERDITIYDSEDRHIQLSGPEA